MTSNETLELWAAQPEFDTRSLEEFAAEGGRPMFPPNRVVRTGWSWPAWLESLGRAVLWSLELIVPRRRIDEVLEGETDRHGRRIPPKPTYRPPAPPPKNFETGYLRSSLPRHAGMFLTENERRAIGGGLTFPFPPNAPGGAGGEGSVMFYRGRPLNREDRKKLRDELPPVYPYLDDSDDDEPSTLTGGPR